MNTKSDNSLLSNTPTGRSRWVSPLTDEEKQGIVQDAKTMSRKTVAEAYKVSISRVHQLISNDIANQLINYKNEQKFRTTNDAELW